VLEGHDPRSGRSLRAPMGHRSVCGYDLTFCAPKSVSLLHLLAPGEIAAEVGAGHCAAVAEAAGYLQRAATSVRRTRAGQVTQLPTTGVVAGAFLHRTSRALDPHLHTHLVVANLARGVDGRWSALDGRRMFAHAHATQGVYHACLRAELSERLGAGWEVPRSGMGDVLGVDPVLRRLFSQRSASIDEYVTRRAGPRPRTTRSRGAFHATRPDKDRTRTVDSLVAEWRQRAADFGFDLGDLTRVVGLGRSPDRTVAVDPDLVRARLGELAVRRRTIAHRDVVAVIAAASPGGMRPQVVEAAATRVIEAAGAPMPAPDRSGGPDATAGRVRRGSGPFEHRWATLDVAQAVERVTGEMTAVAADRGRTVADGRDAHRERAGPDRHAVPARSVEAVRGPVEPRLGR